MKTKGFVLFFLHLHQSCMSCLSCINLFACHQLTNLIYPCQKLKIEISNLIQGICFIKVQGSLRHQTMITYLTNKRRRRKKLN